MARMPAYDRVFLGVDVTKVVGPFTGITAAGIRAALVALHALDPTHPAVCALEPAGQWRPLTAAEFAERELVATVPSGPPDALAEWGQHHLPLGDRPLLFGMRDGFVLVKFAHALGSGGYLNKLVAALLRAAVSGRPPEVPAVRQDRFLLTRAVLRHFARHPGAAVRLLRTPRPLVRPAAATRTVAGWPASNTVRSDRTAEGTVAEIRAWRDRYAPGTSLASIVFAGLVNAFGQTGLEPDPAGLVLLVDGRRYLRKDWQAGPNFVVGQYLAVPEPRDPRDIHRTLHAAMASGRPLAAMAQRLLRQPRAIAAADARNIPDPARPRLILTFGRLDMFADLPWAVPVEQARHTSVSKVGEPDALSVAAWELNGGLHLAASFHSAVFPPDAVAAALRLFCSAPVALLPVSGEASSVAGVPAGLPK
jgi:hypothetical protein